MIRFEAVGLRYPGGEPQRGMLGPPALSDISFALPRGSFTWLLGPSGAGKSSVLRLMHLALRPSRGEVEVLGLRTSRAPRAAMPAVRRRIGVVFRISACCPTCPSLTMWRYRCASPAAPKPRSAPM